MRLGFLQSLYQRPGPFTTVYLDTSADAEDAAKSVELRWRAAWERLEEQGADAATLTALEARIGEHRHETGQRGQVLVAEQGEVVFNDEMPQPPEDVPADQQAVITALPHLMPYLRLRGVRVPHLIAVVDHSGAEIIVVHATREVETVTVKGSDHPLHKAHAGTPERQQRFHQAVEQQWKHNAGRVAEEITKRSPQVRAEAIVLAGEVQQRTLVKDQLGSRLQRKVVEAEASHRDRREYCEHLRDEVAKILESTAGKIVEDTVRLFEEQRGQENRAVEGWQPTLEALQRQQVETVLWVGGQREERMLHIGPEMNQVALTEQALEDMGVEHAASTFGTAAVVRGIAGNSADLMLVDPGEVELSDGIGAILRYR